MLRIVSTGSESSGKTTLIKALAHYYQTDWVPEYARTYLTEIYAQAPDIQYQIEDIIRIAEGQKMAEAHTHNQAPEAAFLVCDTDALVCKIWAEYKYGYCPEALENLFRDSIQTHQNLYLLCAPLPVWEYDPLREAPDFQQRMQIFGLYKQTLEKYGLPYLLVEGDAPTRLEKVLHKLKKGQLIALGGATATGKTQAAIQLSKHFGDCPIISCDARQFYREMSIGTAKPSPEELAAAPHYFINNLSVQQAYTVGDFRKEALNFLYKHFQTHPYAILVGGSGLFYRALCEGMDNFPDIDPQIRTHLESAYAEKGLDFLQAQIQALDPEYAQVMNEQTLQNPRRLLRALEVCVQTNSTYTQFLKTNARPRPNFDIFKLVLSWERKSLYQRIDQRVLDMFAQGLEEEARSLYPLRDLTALQTVGYQELFDYFEHKTSLPKARELIQQHTRNYAKRQITWFKNQGQYTMCSAKEIAKTLMQLND